MTTGAIFGQGTLLKVGDGGGPEVFATIAEVRSIKGPGISRATVDVTTHDSTGGFREFMGALADGGNVTFTVNYKMTESTHNNTTGLISKLVNNTRTNFKLVFPDGGATTWNFSGFVVSFSTSEPIDNVVTADVEVKVSGRPTLV
jgi:predicted secreted protein